MLNAILSFEKPRSKSMVLVFDKVRCAHTVLDVADIQTKPVELSNASLNVV
jgi:hypothetical protein